MSGKQPAQKQDAPKTTTVKPTSQIPVKPPGRSDQDKSSAAAEAAADKKRLETEAELDMPVVKRRALTTSTGEKKSEPVKKSPTVQGQAGEDTLELPVKRRSPRGQLSLPLEDQELDLPAPVKKPRRGAASTTKPETRAKQQTQTGDGRGAKSTGDTKGATKGKSPRRTGGNRTG